MSVSRPRVILDRITFGAGGVKNSIVIDSSDNFIELDGDQLAPGNNQVYGTNASGIKGWKADVSSVISDGSITNAKLANEAQSTIKGRAAGAGTGAPQDLTAAQVKTILTYLGTEVGNTPAGSIAATTVQAAINELDSEKQPLNGDLTALSNLSAANNTLIQRITGVLTTQTPAQVKTSMAFVKADVGLGNVDNTSDVNKPVSTAQAAANNLRVLKSGDSMTGPLSMGANKVTDLANGSNAQDAVSFSQMNTAISAAVTSTNGLITTIVNIGDWNMDSTGLVTIAHGLTLSKIRIVEAMIIADGGGTVTPIDSGDPGAAGTIGGGIQINSSSVLLIRTTGGFFDNTNYDATSFNRGFITIQSIP